MDKTDIQILSHLLNNCRTPDRQIGNSIGISGGAVKSRIQKMMDKKIIEEFALKIEPPVLGYSVLYFVVTGTDLQYILDQVKLIGEPFFVVPCIGSVTVCSIVVKGDPNQKMELAKKILQGVRVLAIFEAKNPGIRSDLTKTDLEIIEILLKDPRLKIEEIAKLAALSTKTVARSLDKLQNDEAIQFTLVYNPNEMKGYIPFAILVGVEGNVKKTLQILEKEFIGSFLQKPFVNMNQIVLFFYSDNIFKLDELTQMVQKITGVRSVDLFIPKKISFPQQWVKNSIREVKASKRLHLSYQIHS
ncbi:MAG: Lrp/AsnC family transcriptional regulator [Thaumarchaeota archaeon]|nr:MAG: Lrp/AsnC family transcriptional regulator [Nitrososphaerota archaeon]TLX82587.1 MAG: Lrp/AsnC family transcriptional regulator [Nitrososphaerota archaeon]